MAKIAAEDNTQAYGYYKVNLDVSAYSKITFKVFRPAGEGGYYLRIKTGDSAKIVNDDCAIAKVAGEWIEVTIDVSKLANKNLYKLYVQFGTNDSSGGANAQGVKGKYIYVSDIYGIK